MYILIMYMYIKVARFKYFKPGNFTLILCKLNIELVIMIISYHYLVFAIFSISYLVVCFLSQKALLILTV